MRVGVDVSELVLDPTFADTFAVRRPVVSPGSFPGETTRSYLPDVPVVGPVQDPTFSQVQRLPEGDRLMETKTFRSQTPISAGDQKSDMADLLIWQDKTYRVRFVQDAPGYCLAVATRVFT